MPKSLGATPLCVRIHGDIPAASGLGSSAALSVAACAALGLQEEDGLGKMVISPSQKTGQKVIIPQLKILIPMLIPEISEIAVGEVDTMVWAVSTFSVEILLM